MHLSKVLAFSIIFSILIQPLGLIAPVLAETVGMEYTDLEPVHAPKVVDGVEYQYDENGNLVGDGERSISWNQDNLPTRVEKDGQVVEFFYDANGRRIVKQAGSNKTVYVNQYYQEPSTKYYFANGRVALLRQGFGGSSTLSFFHQDHLGSTVLLTDSNSQKLTEPLSYFPYGSSINPPSLLRSFGGASNLSYLFTGQEHDPESDLYNYLARLYNPETGSFISADTVGSGNRYAYAANNPLIFTDPTGHDAENQSLGDRIKSFLGEAPNLSPGWEWLGYTRLINPFFYFDKFIEKPIAEEYNISASLTIGTVGTLGGLAYGGARWFPFAKDYYYYNYFYSAPSTPASIAPTPGTLIVRPAAPGELTPADNLHSAPRSSEPPGGAFLGDEDLRSGEIVYGEELWKRYNTSGIAKPEHEHEMAHWRQFVARGYKKAQSMPEFAWNEIEAFEAEITYLENLGVPKYAPDWYSSYLGTRETFISDWGERITGWYSRGRGAYADW